MAGLRGDSRILGWVVWVMSFPLLVFGLSQPRLYGCEESSVSLHGLTD